MELKKYAAYQNTPSPLHVSQRPLYTAASQTLPRRQEQATKAVGASSSSWHEGCTALRHGGSVSPSWLTDGLSTYSVESPFYSHPLASGQIRDAPQFCQNH